MYGLLFCCSIFLSFKKEVSFLGFYGVNREKVVGISFIFKVKKW